MDFCMKKLPFVTPVYLEGHKSQSLYMKSVLKKLEE